MLHYSPHVTANAWQASARGSQLRGISYERLYAYRFSGVGQQRRQAVWRGIARYMLRRMGALQRILDPAAGRGELITAVPAAERWGVDLVGHGVPESAEVRMIIDDIMAADLPTGYFDGVFDAQTTLSEMLDEDIPWISRAHRGRRHLMSGH